jgi:hypothetical protein
VSESTRELYSVVGKKVPPGKGEGKRPFFPEDIVNSEICFHFGLLSFGPLTIDNGQ